MTDESYPVLPHHKLIAFGVARNLLVAVRAAQIRDVKLRDEATRAAKGACLNCAEGAGRVTRPDKARAFNITRGEAVEAAAAVEIAPCAAMPRRRARSPWRASPIAWSHCSPPSSDGEQAAKHVLEPKCERLQRLRNLASHSADRRG
jgi:four helix bundle protein